MTWRGIVGKFVDVAGLRAHVDGLSWTGFRPSFIVVHNTSAPDAKTYAGWRANPEKHGNWTPEQWARNLESYYRNQGWSAGPHAFVCRDGILLFTPFNVQGTHSPAWNSRSIGIETVGEFESDPFDNGVRDNLIATLGILHAKLGLIPGEYRAGVRGLHFHKEDPVTTHKTCPGRHIVKADLVADVETYMGDHADGGDHAHIPVAVHTAPTQSLTDDEMYSVAWLQSALNALHVAVPALKVDGALGLKTKTAVKAFQANHHPPVADGIAGPLTRLAIKTALSV